MGDSKRRIALIIPSNECINISDCVHYFDVPGLDVLLGGKGDAQINLLGGM